MPVLYNDGAGRLLPLLFHELAGHEALPPVEGEDDVSGPGIEHDAGGLGKAHHRPLLAVLVEFDLLVGLSLDGKIMARRLLEEPEEGGEDGSEKGENDGDAGGNGERGRKGGKSSSLPAPELKSALWTETRDAVALRWSPVEGATGYRVLRRTMPRTEDVEIVTPSVPEYFDKSATPGGTYFYVIRALLEGEKEGLPSEGRTVVVPRGGEQGERPGLRPPRKLEAQVREKVEFGKRSYTVSLTWEAVPGALSYNLYRKDHPEDYRVIAITTENRHLDSAVEEGESYFYKVTAVDEVQESDFSYGPFVQAVGLLRIRKMEVEGGEPGGARGYFVEIEWLGMPWAVLYNVYRREGEDYRLLGSAGGTTFVDRDVEGGKAECYVVTAVDDKSAETRKAPERCLTIRRGFGWPRKLPHPRLVVRRSLPVALVTEKLTSPGDTAVDSKGRIYVLDSGARDVKMFDSTGAYLRTVAEGGKVLRQPLGIGIDGENRLCVADGVEESRSMGPGKNPFSPAVRLTGMSQC